MSTDDTIQALQGAEGLRRTSSLICVLALSLAEQQAALVQSEVAPPDRRAHSALTSMLTSLLLLSTIDEPAEPMVVQRQTIAADIFELPCSMVKRARKVASLSDGGLSITGAGTAGGT